MASLISNLGSKLYSNLKSIPNNILNYTKLSQNSQIFTNSIRHSSKSCFPQFVNLPKVTKVGGTGDAFKTQIKRKRIIEDPNKPNFVHIEPLKWANWKMLRDVRRRYIFRDYHFEKICLSTVDKNRLLPSSIREVAKDQNQSLPRDAKFMHLRNRCAITGRSRGVVKRYRLSRLVWRDLADYNKLSGVIKASWK